MTSYNFTEIQGYIDSCRTTHLNQNKGLQNLLLLQDRNGVTTGVVADRIVNVGSGSIKTNFLPNLDEFSIIEVSGTDHKVLTKSIKQGVKYYLNGVLQPTALPLPDPTTPLTIDNTAIIGGEQIDKTQYVFKVFTGALDQAEVTSEFNDYSAIGP